MSHHPSDIAICGALSAIETALAVFGKGSSVTPSEFVGALSSCKHAVADILRLLDELFEGYDEHPSPSPLDRLKHIEEQLDALQATENELLAILLAQTKVSATFTVTNLTTKQTATFFLEGALEIMSNPILDDALGVSYAINFLDADGNPAAPPVLASVPVWSEDSAGKLITLTPSADGLSATAVPTGKGLGTVNVSVVIPSAAAGGTFPGATATDALPINADVATQASLSSTPIVAPPAAAAKPAAVAAVKKP